MELLLSLQSADELRMASDYRFRWLDLKNPLTGSLGCPDEKVAEDFLKVANSLPRRRKLTLSIAIGELIDGIAPEEATEKSRGRNSGNRFALPLPAEVLNQFDFVKVALAKTLLENGNPDRAAYDERADWLELAWSLSEQLSDPSKLILVHYADHQLARAVHWQSVLQASQLLRCEYVLVDTFDKSSGTLLTWLSPETCHLYASQASELGIKLSLAGSLRQTDFDSLRKSGAAILGIRGAACREGSRVSQLCRDRLHRLSECFESESSLKSFL